MSKEPDIVFIVLDSVRYDAVGPDSEGFADAPFLESLASESLSFRRAYAPAPWTVPSHASIFTGVYPTEHGTSHGGKKYLNPEFPTLAEKLQEVGYHTEIYTNNVHLVPEFGFTRGFKEVNRGPLVANEDDLIDWNMFIENREHDSGFAKYIEIVKYIIKNREKKLVDSLRSGVEMKTNYHRGDSGGQAAANYFKDRCEPDRPTFTFINLMEAHNPFRPPKRFREHDPIEIDGWEYELGERKLSEEDLEVLRSLYRGEIEYLDGIVRQLHESLADNNTLFVVTSDHGVSLGEHQKLYHGSCLYETTIHVPLVISGISRSDIVETPVGIIGLFRTLLELAGIEVPSYARGRNVTRTTDSYVLSEMHGTDDWLERHARENHGEEAARMVDATQRALIAPTMKLIRNEETGETELYDINNDPYERDPVNDTEQIKKMEKKLDELIQDFKVRKNHGEQEKLNNQMEQKLKDLGYMK